MLHLYVPPSLRRFAPRRVLPGPGARYVPLEYDLVESLRPKLVVDLGAGDGGSFFTYCQSMHEHDIDGVCYAIDSWESESGTHPQATFDAINDHGRKFYPGLYYVIRMVPSDALRHFDEQSIDLLRINGLRPDVTPGDDIEAWYARVRPGGVIVWHGATGAQSLWTSLVSRCPTVTFRAGRGVGMALKPGAEPTGELLRLLFTENQGSELERFYVHVHEHHEFRRLLTMVQGTA